MKKITACFLLIAACAASANDDNQVTDNAHDKSEIAASANDESVIDSSFIRIRFGGWSKHLRNLNKGVRKDIEYNESHKGIGIERVNPLKGGWYWGYGAAYMLDSFKKDTFSASLSYGYSFDPFEDVKFSTALLGGVQYRSYVNTINEGTYVSIERITVPFIVPEFTVSYKDLGISFLIFPVVSRNNGNYHLEKPVLFAQFFYDF